MEIGIVLDKKRSDQEHLKKKLIVYDNPFSGILQINAFIVKK